MSDDEPYDLGPDFPPDLERILRDPNVIVRQDAAVFELIAKWMSAPSDTLSAASKRPTPEEERNV